MNQGLRRVLTLLDEYPEKVEQGFAVAAVEYEPPTREECATVLVAIRDARTHLADFAADVTTMLLAESGERSFTVEDLGEVEIKKRTRRTGWRYDELVPQVVARIADEPGVLFDPDTGERMPWVHSVQALCGRLRDCFGFTAKVTGLRDLGLQPDEWCTEEPDGYAVKLPGRSL